MATTIVALTETEKKDLTDELIRIIAQFPLVGTTINWAQFAADSIIEAFQTKGIRGDTALEPRQINELIEVFLTPESRGKSYTVARKIYFEVGYLLEEREAAQASTVEAADAVPTDETHEFAVATRRDLARGVFPLENTKLTEAEAFERAEKSDVISGGVYLVIARPKTEPWKIVSRTAKG